MTVAIGEIANFGAYGTILASFSLIWTNTNSICQCDSSSSLGRPVRRDNVGYHLILNFNYI
jgi:hypothetical protein